jgi:hypothetical protein
MESRNFDFEYLSQELLTNPTWGKAWSALTETERRKFLGKLSIACGIHDIGHAIIEHQTPSKSSENLSLPERTWLLKMLADAEIAAALLGDLEERSLAVLRKTNSRAAANRWRRRELRRTLCSLLWAQLRKSLGINALVDLYEKVRH